MLIDEEEADLDKPFDVHTPSANVAFDPFVPDVGEMLTISSELFQFKVVAVRAFEDQVSGYNR